MNARVGKVMVSVAIAFMFIFPLIILTDEETEADGVDYSRWYYNQLDDDAKVIYNGFEGLKSGTSDQCNVKGENMYPEYADKKISDISSDGKITVQSTTLLKAMNAAKMDDPELYWTNLHVNMSIKGTYVMGADVTLTVEEIDGIPHNITGDVNIQAVIDAAIASGDLVIEPDMSTTAKAKIIHDFIINKLEYATDALEKEKSTGIVNNSIRSTYTAFMDDEVVCEGYAKAFKYLCDKYDIPCITIVGEANNGKATEGHMWNLMLGEDNYWYTVDCTWDDPINGKERSSYFLVGQNTIVDSMTISKSHNTSTTTVTYGFSLPSPMANSAYDGDAIHVQLSFESNGGSEVPVQNVKLGEAGVRPDNPTYAGHAFYNWYADPECKVPWNWNTKLLLDTTVYAKWTELPTYSITFMANGGNGAPDSIVVYEGEQATIPDVTPTWDKHKFMGWNTMADGSGTAYRANEKITLTSDITLYAIWEEQKSADDWISELIKAINIDGIIQDLKNAWEDFKTKSEEFLGEPWIGGIPNLYFVIGGAVLFFIIAVAATRKT